MAYNIYTVDQVAVMLGLHPKTVRRLINGGKLKANKVGGQWRITEDDLKQIMGHENTPGLVDTEIVKSTFETASVTEVKTLSKIQVSAVIDIHVEDNEVAMRISNTIIAVMNCKDPEYGYARYNHIYFKDERKARFMFWGQPLFIGHILLTFSELIK